MSDADANVISSPSGNSISYLCSAPAEQTCSCLILFLGYFRILLKRQNTDVRAETVLDENLSFKVRLCCIIVSVFISGCWSCLRKLEAVIASKEASAWCWVKDPRWWWRDPFFRSTVRHLSHNIRVWWRWECWHADQERFINDLVRQMLPELAPQSIDTLATAWNHIDIITLTQKWISTELCLVPEWNWPTNTRPKFRPGDE